MAAEWKTTQDGQTTYSSLQIPDQVYDTKIVVAHERQGKFPYLLVFGELVNPDHWWGSKRRFGHGHQITYELLYFDPEGSGEFLAGEELRWLPHYGSLTSAMKEVGTIDDAVRQAIERLPSAKLFMGISKGKGISKPEGTLIELLQISSHEAILASYLDSAIVEQEARAYVEKNRKWLMKFPGSDPENIRFNPTENPYKRRLLDYVLKTAASFDIEHAPELIGTDQTSGLLMGLEGISAFPSPKEFLEGADKEDKPGGVGDTGLRARRGYAGALRDPLDAGSRHQSIRYFMFDGGISKCGKIEGEGQISKADSISVNAEGGANVGHAMVDEKNHPGQIYDPLSGEWVTPEPHAAASMMHPPPDFQIVLPYPLSLEMGIGDGKEKKE